MSGELIHALEQLKKEKGIDKEFLLEAIEAALLSAYRRNFGPSQNIKVEVDRITGAFKVFSIKKVVETPEDDDLEISFEDARNINTRVEIDDMINIDITPRKFGRIAAQAAKQVVVQRIKEAERNMIYEEFINREGDIVSGTVQRSDRRNIIIDLGKVEAILPQGEQAAGEDYMFKERIKVYILEVKMTPKGTQVIVSRSSPELIKRLFELEVPEIHDGVVEIKGISREAGSRTKIAVYSRDSDVDPVGACVGHKGTRVQRVVDELRGEKIDIIRWSNNPQEFISASLSPAKVVRVLTDEEEREARVIVPDYQLSLAIGKEGQNARLSAKLTGWKIDIKSESQARSEMEKQFFSNSDREGLFLDIEQDDEEDEQ